MTKTHTVFNIVQRCTILDFSLHLIAAKYADDPGEAIKQAELQEFSAYFFALPFRRVTTRTRSRTRSSFCAGVGVVVVVLFCITRTFLLRVRVEGEGLPIIGVTGKPFLLMASSCGHVDMDLQRSGGVFARHSRRATAVNYLLAA